MSITAEIRWTVRERAHFACEYCGVSETDTGGELTLDHYQPHTRGGSDDLTNLLYCCPRCNQYKADYWPTRSTDAILWNPRHQPIESCLVPLVDGTLYPINPMGTFTLHRLRLNRAPLVAYRLQKRAHTEATRLLSQYHALLSLLEQLSIQQAALLEEQQQLLAEQRALLRLLLHMPE